MGEGVRAETLGDGSQVCVGGGGGDEQAFLVSQAPSSLSTHPLALWSSRAWNSDWSWSTLGRGKEAEVKGRLLQRALRIPPRT